MKYINWALLKKDFIRWMPWSITFLFYWFVVWNDYISSILSNRIPGVEEQNPYARNEAMHFVLHKAIIVDLVFGLAFFLVALVGYHILKYWNKTFAAIVANGFLFYYAFERLTTAVVINYLLALNMYVKEVKPDMIKVMGF